MRAAPVRDASIVVRIDRDVDPMRVTFSASCYAAGEKLHGSCPGSFCRMHGGTTDLIEVHSVSASYDGLAISEKIPRNTKPGSKVIQIALNCFVGHTGVSDKQNAARSIGLDYRLNTVRPRSVTTVFLLPWKPRLVANAKVQGHAWRDLEFILEESQ